MKRPALAAGVLVLTALAMAAVLPEIRRATGEAALLPADDPAARLDREIAAEFGMENPLVWVMEARTGSIWTAENLSRLQALTREVFTVPGVIALDVIGLASPNLRDVQITEDGMEQVYLMGEVPRTPEAIAALRQRVETDPNYRGNLTSLDGRAAMVVANLRLETDMQAAGMGALALRDKYRSENVDVYAVGAPVMRIAVAQSASGMIRWAAAAASLGLLAGAVVMGRRAFVAALSAAVLAGAWTVIAAAALGVMVLPWAVFALLPIVCAAAGLQNGRSGGLGLELAAATTAGGIAMALCSGHPAGAFGFVLAVGGPAAAAAGGLMGWLLTVRADSGSPAQAGAGKLWMVAALGMAVAALGIAGARTSFGVRGYAERYLPSAAVADLRAMVRLFPPPTILTFRVRGEPGFVRSPEVLRSLDAAVEAARAEPGVRSAMSVADVVKMVNRAFHDNRPEYRVLPEEASAVGRYLTLGYNPQFRRFVTRALDAAAVWVYLDSERPGDIARVRKAVEESLARAPIPGADVDLMTGDGISIISMAGIAKKLTCGAAAFLLAFVIVLWRASGRQRAFAAAGGAALAGIAAAGAIGWTGMALDLVSIPLALGAGISGAVLAASCSPGGGRHARVLAAAMALAGLAASAAPAPTRLLGLAVLAPALAVLAIDGWANRPRASRQLSS